MKSKTKREVHRFPLNLLHYGNSYYIERIAALERALARKPRQLQIDMLGEGEIPADWALLIRSILNQRAARTQVTTNARSSLQNGSVLVWLLGDCRLIRNDARIFFRRANVSEDTNSEPEKVWNEDDMKYVDSFSEADPDEADHAKVLQHIHSHHTGFWKNAGMIGLTLPHGRDEKENNNHSSGFETESAAADWQSYS